MKDRPVEDISEALHCKCVALGFMGRYREQQECAKEWYCIWNTKPTDVGAIRAVFQLISSSMQNYEFADAQLYASTLYEIINHKHDNKIPEDQRQRYIAKGAYYLAQATLQLAKNGGIPPEEKQKAGQKVIALARRALEMHTQLYGAEDDDVANDLLALAEALDYFNDGEEEEVLHLFEQAKAIYVRLQGNSTPNVAIAEEKLGDAYRNRARRAHDANDLDRLVANLELALPRYRESARIFRAVNRIDNAEHAARFAVDVEKLRRQYAITR